MVLDVKTVSHDKLERLKPCLVCGCRSFHLENGMYWQCSRCRPPGRGAIHFELDNEPTSDGHGTLSGKDVVQETFDGRETTAAEWSRWHKLLASLSNDPHMRIQAFVAAVKELAGNGGTPPEDHAEELSGPSVLSELKLMVKRLEAIPDEAVACANLRTWMEKRTVVAINSAPSLSFKLGKEPATP